MPKDCHGRLGVTVAVFIALGSPAALHAQSVPAAPSQVEPTTIAADDNKAVQAEAPCVVALQTPMTLPEEAGALPKEGAQPTEQVGDTSSCPSIAPPPPVRPPAPNIFGSVAVSLGSSALDGHWNDVRTSTLEGVDGPWSELVAQAGPLQEGDQLTLVNRWVNEHVRYVNDSGEDSWSDAANTIIRGTGDCEDFAIAKMALLRLLGVPSDDMYLVIVRDRFLKADHAVLAVRRGEIMHVLDNRTDMILSAEQIADYRPMLSYSGPFAWAYGYQVSGRAVAAGHAELP